MGIRLVASVYAGLAFFATALCLIFYPLTRAKTQEIADELSERRKKFASE
jgi:Na+/melibiose symporter-like transporter